MSTEACFFSIIIPAYNRASLLPITLKFVQQQNFTDFEIVLVDDGSTDSTEEVINSLHIPGLRYFKTENRERGHARNFGVQQARGRYVFFLDSDDHLLPNHLAQAYEYLTSNQYPEMFHCRMELVNEAGKKLFAFPHMDESFTEKLLKRNYMASAVFLKKEVALAFPFLEDRDVVFGEEWLIWLRLVARYPFHYINEVSYHQVQHEGRSVNRMDPDKIVHSAQQVKGLLSKDQVFMGRFGARLPHILSTFYITAANNYFISRRFQPGLDSLKKALSLRPGLWHTKSFVAALKNALIPGL